ncbi:hypothetical protein [Alkalicoccobacillus porphyridii]|uniref:Uncharacterized protein n=1 Tax=Alkalicoccobacillus porphyridii TaxID=2597270 RepID=A0A553ZZA8_9BACI|nr:hypothetical protein [Alkalicoccobacillus porphyridii]TSB46763.1 hypothetical protein FN960_10490 [Alkalicoccobacillus porphyridii]
MSLFEMIFNNPLLMIAIIFGLVSLFGRMSKGSQSQDTNRDQQRQQRRPTTEGQEEGQVDWREIFRQEEQTPEPEPKREPVESTSYSPTPSQATHERDELYDRLDEMKRKKREAQEKVAAQLISPTQKKTQTIEADDQYDLTNVTGKEAMRAVVWAEILGNPRSRNPHKAFASNRRR